MAFLKMNFVITWFVKFTTVWEREKKTAHYTDTVVIAVDTENSVNIFFDASKGRMIEEKKNNKTKLC